MPWACSRYRRRMEPRSTGFESRCSQRCSVTRVCSSRTKGSRWHCITDRHRCWRASEEISLTKREFAVLECLMRRPGEVLSKGEILDHVWDFAFDGDPNIVEVYIRRLRRKIDEPFGRHDIETVRGAGYRLSEGQP